MKSKIIINASFWNERIEVEQIRKVHSTTKNIDKSMNFIQKNLREYILKNKGDGFQFNIYEFEDHSLIVIELFYSLEQMEYEINVDYLKSYFNKFESLSYEIERFDDNEYDHFIIIRHIEDGTDLLNELNEKRTNFKYQNIYTVFERGASDFSEIILLSIIGNASYDLIKSALLIHFGNSYYVFDSISKNEIEPIKDYLYEHYGITPAALQIKEFTVFEDNIFITFQSRDEFIKVEWNKRHGIKRVIR